MSKNFLILMSGGTTPVINSTLVGIIQKVKKKSSQIKIFSGQPGISRLGHRDPGLAESQ